MNHVKHVIPMSDSSVSIKPEDIQPTVLPDAFIPVSYTHLDVYKRQIKMRSRRYAKRQLSWFKRDDRIVWFDMDEFTIDEVVKDILHRIEAA